MKLRLTAVGALAGLFAISAFAQTELKFGHVGEPGSLIGAAADEFAKRANAKLGGKYNHDKSELKVTIPAESTTLPPIEL